MNETARELREQATMLSREHARLLKQAKDIEQAEIDAARPKMPTVLTDAPAYVIFTKYQSGRVYTFAAVGWRVDMRTDVRWAVTGSETRRFNWRGLLEWIGETNWASVHVVTESLPLIDPDDSPPAAESMGSFGRVASVARLRGEPPVEGGGSSRDNRFIDEYAAGPYSC